MDKKKLFWMIFHITIITILVFQIVYCIYQFYNTAGALILFQSATELDYETMVVRRLYAIEFWISVLGLVIYLAIVYKKQLSKHLTNEKKDRE